MARRLIRSSNERILGGVCGGLAAWLDASPDLVRLLWIVLSLFPGPMWLLYLVLWVALPEGPT